MVRHIKGLLVLGCVIVLGTNVIGQDTTVTNLFPIPDELPEFVPGEVLVKFREDIGPRALQSQMEQVGIRMVREYQRIGVVRYRLISARNVSQSMEGILETLRQDPNVEYAEPNYIVHILETSPNDSRFEEQWALRNTGQSGGVADADIDASEAWDIQRGSSNVVVGVIDTGIDDGHPDLQANMWRNPGESGRGRERNGVDDDGNGYIDDWRGWDFANNDNNPFDDNAHGTHCAGIIGAVGNNSRGISGINWTVGLVGLKFLTGSGSGATGDAVEAILYAVRMGIPILSNSWGGGGFSQALADAIETADQSGILFVAAAGNEGKDNDSSPNYPSNYFTENVLAIASSDNSDRRSSFSNYGRTTVDLAAPGSNILSTTPNNNYQVFSGTSMATPYAAGAAALVMAQYPDIDHLSLKYRLMGSVDLAVDFANITLTEGRLNVFAALSSDPRITTEKLQDTNSQIPYTVTAHVVDDGEIDQITLMYSMSGVGSGSGAVPMINSGIRYLAEIPAQPLETTISYFVRAADNQGNIADGRKLSFRVGGSGTPPGNGGGGCCGAAAVTIQTGSFTLDLASTILLNLLLFLILPYYIYKRRS